MSIGTRITREWKALLKDKRLLATLLLLPMAYMFLFGYLYSQDKVRHIPIIYMDHDQSELSQQILQAISVSETFQLNEAVHSEEELLQKIQSGEAYAGLILPARFSQTVTQGRQAEIMTVIDGSNLIIANRVLSGINEIAQTYSRGISIKRLEAGGISPDQGIGVRMGYRLLFNPGASYSIYLLLGLMGTVLQSVTMLGMTLSMTREKEERNTPPIHVSRRVIWKYLFAKAVPYFLIAMVNISIALGVLKTIFHIPVLGLFGLLLLLSFAFVLSLLGFSFFVSLFAKTKVHATQLTMLLIYPSFFLSGFTWPSFAMPQWVNGIAHLLPVAYFLHGIREIALKGNGWDQVCTDVFALLAFAVLTTILAWISLGWNQQKGKEGEYEGVGNDPGRMERTL